jgi:hypothetical protein
LRVGVRLGAAGVVRVFSKIVDIGAAAPVDIPMNVAHYERIVKIAIVRAFRSIIAGPRACIRSRIWASIRRDNAPGVPAMPTLTKARFLAAIAAAPRVYLEIRIDGDDTTLSVESTAAAVRAAINADPGWYSDADGYAARVDDDGSVHVGRDDEADGLETTGPTLRLYAG